MNPILMFLIGFNLVIVYYAWQRGKDIDFALEVLEKLKYMRQHDIISDVQARVFLNDLQNPYDRPAVIGVYNQLREIYEKHQNSNR